MAPLSSDELKTVVSVLAQKLDSLNIDYAIMGGAATCLLSGDPNRRTEDVDLVIHVDHRKITADNLTTQLLKSFPSDFEGLVELEVFDYQSWPQRPQYDLQTATRTTLNINGQKVKLFSPEWILREKILSQYQRQGSRKEGTDIRDIISMIPLAVPGKPELNFNQSQELQTALANLVQKRPDLSSALKAKIKCSAVFHN
ncbi:hypothetical protein ACO22_06133 [Paracoccidioides brasiliensis]|uniref:Uncharacterized protein n=1 Tax=Paracoccidioides brasiliensis TaxID=121759 RepID=A0A1D2J8G5_PARBR|nr:hypothetical protein ACO22_06133 [Paracoccidioides brasiliensis]